MAQAEPTWAPSWPWLEITNGALPIRLSAQTRWSRTRVTNIVRYIPTRSGPVKPRDVWRSSRWRGGDYDGTRICAVAVDARVPSRRPRSSGHRQVGQRPKDLPPFD